MYILIPLFNRSIWLLDRLLSVLDSAVNDDSKQEWVRENVSTVCPGAAGCRSQRRQNKSTLRRERIVQTRKNLSANADIWKIPNIGRYIDMVIYRSTTNYNNNAFHSRLICNRVMGRTDDVSCLREQGAWRYANTYFDRQVGQTIVMLEPNNLLVEAFMVLRIPQMI